MLGWAAAAWLAMSGCAMWWLTWQVVVATWHYHGLFAAVSGVLGFVMGVVVFAMANEVARS